MERFQKIKIKKNNWKKLNINTICRFCGLEHEEKFNIMQLIEDGIEFKTKVEYMLGISVKVDDKMPQNACSICLDKVNDFYEFRLMALNTERQTREALGIEMIEKKPNIHLNKTPVVRLVDLKHSKDDKILIERAFDKLNRNLKDVGRKRIETSVPTQATKKSRKDIKCNICADVTFSYSNDLQDHQTKEHIPLISKYACGSCRETFEQLSDFKAHETMHTKEKIPYTCYICENNFMKFRDFSKHMTNYNCNKKEKLDITVPDIKCTCKKKFLTQNLFEWHGCFLRTKGNCSKCGQYFPKKKALFKHYVFCESKFELPDYVIKQMMEKGSIKTEKATTSIKINNIESNSRGLRKKTVPERNVLHSNVNNEIMNSGDYDHFENDITYDNFGIEDDDDDDGEAGESGHFELNNSTFEPIVQVREQNLPIIDIKRESITEENYIVKPNAEMEQGNKQQSKIVVKKEKQIHPVAVVMKKSESEIHPLKIKKEKPLNHGSIVQIINPLALAAKTQKKILKIPHLLASKIKKEKMDVAYGDRETVRDEADPDPEEEEAMNYDISKIKAEKLNPAYEDIFTNNSNKRINPLALALRDRSETQLNSLVISSVTSVCNATEDCNSSQPLNEALDNLLKQYEKNDSITEHEFQDSEIQELLSHQ